MAKFTSGELRLKDDQRITFGTGLDSNMWWDGAELRLDTTISGVDPTQPYHLTTRWYVDQAVTSGSVVSGTLPHHNLTAFDTYDDHLQYVPVNASRGFTASVSGVDPSQSYELTTKFYVDDLISTVSGDIMAEIGNNYISDSEMTVISGDIINYITTTPNVISHSNLDDLEADDHTQYILADGTRAFSNTVSGVTPIVDAHLATKGYVDSVAQGLDWQDSVLDIVPLASGVQVTGNRYIASTTSGSWTQDNIYEWNGSSWTETVTLEGFAAWVEIQDALYVYSNGVWVQFGSTVTHNNLSGKYGDGADYYHLTTTQKSDLTGGSDASNQHTHDDRYYTESEITVISGDIVNQIPTDYVSDSEMTVISGDIINSISGLYVSYSEMTVISGDIMSSVSNNYISNSEMTTISGDIVAQIPVIVRGRQSIGNGASYVDVSFATVGGTNYTIGTTLQNTSDSPPSIYAYIVSATTASGFRVTFMGDMDSANYVLNWSVIPD